MCKECFQRERKSKKVVSVNDTNSSAKDFTQEKERTTDKSNKLGVLSVEEKIKKSTNVNCNNGCNNDREEKCS